MSKSQDYIARIRYQNDLPPPLLPPKLLKYSGHDEEQIGSSSQLSLLIRKEGVNGLVSLDNDIGLPLDIIQAPLLFDETSRPRAPDEKEKHSTLHPNDRILLRDPQVEKVSKSQPQVSFLRRTEYTGAMIMGNGSNNVSRSVTPHISREEDSPAAQLRAIEATFENATKTLNDLTKIRHPTKKNLKPKKVWNLLPDVSRMDQKFSSIKFGSNSLSKVHDLDYKTALFRQMRLEDINWMSFYTTDEATALSVKRTLDDLEENIPKENAQDSESFKYTKVDDYDLHVSRLDGEIQEIALRFDEANGTVYYNPISRKADLKRRKIQESHRELLEEKDFDVVNLKIREPTVEEFNKKNNLRHEHDSVTYERVELDDEEDDLETFNKSKK